MLTPEALRSHIFQCVLSFCLFGGLNFFFRRKKIGFILSLAGTYVVVLFTIGLLFGLTPIETFVRDSVLFFGALPQFLIFLVFYAKHIRCRPKRAINLMYVEHLLSSDRRHMLRIAEEKRNTNAIWDLEHLMN